MYTANDIISDFYAFNNYIFIENINCINGLVLYAIYTYFRTITSQFDSENFSFFFVFSEFSKPKKYPEIL